MGSSTASERTINTSTESANTVLTNVTATDGETTEDSLDHETITNQDILVSLDSGSSLDGKPQQKMERNVKNLTTNNDAKIINILDQDILLPDTPFINERRKSDYTRTKDGKGPHTAPPATHASDTRFPFDECSLAESQSAKEPKSVFDSAGSSPSQRNTAKFIFDVPMPTSPTETRSPDLLLANFSVDEKPPKSPKASSSKGETKFNFDILSIPTELVSKRNSIESKSFKSRCRKSSGYSSTTPPLPDLRVDFFSETIDDQSKNNNERRPLSCLLTGDDFDIMKQDAEGNKSSSRRPSATRTYSDNANQSPNQINVTTNPLDNGSGCCNQSCPSYSNGQYRCCACCSNNPNRKLPQATIVVQQASLSLDYSNVSTILLKDENDFVSNTSPGNTGSHHKLSVKKKKQQRDDNMKQLLDVKNQLTQEEMYDFQMKLVLVVLPGRKSFFFLQYRLIYRSNLIRTLKNSNLPFESNVYFYGMISGMEVLITADPNR